MVIASIVRKEIREGRIYPAVHEIEPAALILLR
jgi:hypothetical protein